MTQTNDIPRRIRLDLFTPAEKAIYDAVGEVEKAGAHPLLTEAVILLQKARDKVADYVDQEIATDDEGVIQSERRWLKPS